MSSLIRPIDPKLALRIAHNLVDHYTNEPELGRLFIKHFSGFKPFYNVKASNKLLCESPNKLTNNWLASLTDEIAERNKLTGLYTLVSNSEDDINIRTVLQISPEDRLAYLGLMPAKRSKFGKEPQGVFVASDYSDRVAMLNPWREYNKGDFKDHTFFEPSGLKLLSDFVRLGRRVGLE